MMMMVSLESCKAPLEKLKNELSSLGDSLNVSINLMHEKVFSAMHRI
jgi:ACT domain-containing protein